MQRGGFTLIELLIVVMLLGILAGVAAPRYSSAIAQTELTSDVKQLAAHLRRAQSVARTSSSEVTITFDTTNSTYSSAELTMLDRPADPLLVNLASGDYPTRIVAPSFGGLPSVTFDLYGNAIASGTVALSLGGSQRTIKVNQAGGVSY